LVGDRQRLDAQLLLNLKRLKAGRFLVHVGVNELADAAIEKFGGDSVAETRRNFEAYLADVAARGLQVGR